MPWFTLLLGFANEAQEQKELKRTELVMESIPNSQIITPVVLDL
jgi:hypothetical protein